MRACVPPLQRHIQHIPRLSRLNKIQNIVWGDSGTFISENLHKYTNTSTNSMQRQMGRQYDTIQAEIVPKANAVRAVQQEQTRQPKGRGLCFFGATFLSKHIKIPDWQSVRRSPAPALRAWQPTASIDICTERKDGAEHSQQSHKPEERILDKATPSSVPRSRHSLSALEASAVPGGVPTQRSPIPANSEGKAFHVVQTI